MRERERERQRQRQTERKRGRERKRERDLKWQGSISTTTIFGIKKLDCFTKNKNYSSFKCYVLAFRYIKLSGIEIGEIELGGQGLGRP